MIAAMANQKKVKPRSFKKLATHIIEEYGFAVFPLNGKFPAIPKEEGGRGCNDATTDTTQIEIWAKRYPTANVGIATGKASGIVVIDEDIFGAADKLNLPKTFTVATGKGRHFYFTHDCHGSHDIRNSCKKLIDGVDIRGTGGYVVSLKSIHPETNRPYSIIDDSAMAPLPQDIIDRLKKETAMAATAAEPVVTDPEKYVRSALDACCREVSMTPQGGRNENLNRQAFLIGTYLHMGILSEDEAFTRLRSAALTSGLQIKEAERAIRNGLAGGKSKPRKLNVSEQKRLIPKMPVIKTPLDFLISCLHEGEVGDAKVFCRLTDGRKLYDHTGKEWLTYLDGRWQKDDKQSTPLECHELLKDAYIQATSEISSKILELRSKKDVSAEQQELNNERAGYFNKEKENFRKRILQLGAQSRLHNILNLARGMSGAVATDFDKNPLVLNLANGVYDFRSQKFRQHNPRDLITKRAHVYFDPDAHCPYWILFLADICNDDWERMRYLQKIAGLMLTGRADQQYLFFFYGEGANGKSTFFNVIRLLLSEFYVTIPIDVLLSRQKNSTDEYQLARLKGARVVTASEIPAGKRLNESLVKDLVSNDLITARNPYGMPFDYEPTHKLCLIGNHKPQITGTDHGIWRRIRIFPFEHVIPEENRRPMDEVMAEFAQESSGILNWAIEGYTLMEQEGLEMPEAVKKATTEYQNESDSIGLFLEECTERTTPDWKVPLKNLWKKYVDHCEEGGEYPTVRSSRSFGSVLRTKKYEVAKSTDNKTFVFGIKITLKEGDAIT